MNARVCTVAMVVVVGTLAARAHAQDAPAMPTDTPRLPSAAPPAADGVPMPPPDAADPGLGRDPPGRVGRIAVLQGPVSYKAAGAGDWAIAQLNHPITRGDSLWVDDSGRAEVQIGTVVVRVAANSSLYVPNLDETTVQLSLTQGAVTLTVRQVMEGDLLEFDLPNAAVTLQRPGSYRFDVASDAQDTAVTLRDGAHAEMMVGGQVMDIEDGHVEEIRGLDGASVQEHELDAPDGFDSWTQQRDQSAVQSASLQYVSPNTVGYEDLDRSGEWIDSPDYGTVWTPTSVPAGWAPYRYGHWAYIAPWGWVWIDDAWWGFAVYHYGRWNWWGNRWVWSPGPLTRRPCWAPALVGWSHAGAGVSWWPLGYHEPFVPGYHTSFNYVREVNLSQHFTSVAGLRANSHFVNRAIPNATTTVPPATVRDGTSVGAAHRPVSPSEAMHGPVENHGPEAPGGLAYRQGSASVPVPHPPSAASDRRTIYRATPPGRPGGAPVSYAQPPARPATSISPSRPPQITHAGPASSPGPAAGEHEPVITRVPSGSREPIITRVPQAPHDAYNGRVPMPMPVGHHYEPSAQPFVRPASGFAPGPHGFAPAPRFTPAAGAAHFEAPHAAPAPAVHGGGGFHHR